MLLSSLRRMRVHCAGMSNSPLSSEVKNDRLLMMWLPAISEQVERFLNRELYIQKRIQYYDAHYNQLRYFVDATPVRQIYSVYGDVLGLFLGQEYPLPLNYNGQTDNEVNLYMPFIAQQRRAIRITYVGGMAFDAVHSRYNVTITGNVTNFSVNQYLVGQLSGAMGIVKGWDSTNKKLYVETYYGQFRPGDGVLPGETIQAYSDEGTTAITGLTATLDSYNTIDFTGKSEQNGDSFTSNPVTVKIPERSLLDVANPIVMATEVQIRYLWKHTTDLENTSTSRDGQSTRSNQNRKGDGESILPLLPEVMSLLQPYRRYV